MNLNFEVALNRTKDTEFSKDLIHNFHKYLESFTYKYDAADMMDTINTIFTQEEAFEFYRKQDAFLESFFDKELADLSQGETFIVTNRYNGDRICHRFSIAQYQDKKMNINVVPESVLPVGVKLNDIVRKIDGKFYYDEYSTKYVNDNREKIIQDILDKRNA